VIEYLYEAAQALQHPDTASRWEHYLRWASDCWQGRADQVIATLEKQLAEKIDGGAASSEVPQAVSRTITYLTNNRPRMDYPRYRREGLR